MRRRPGLARTLSWAVVTAVLGGWPAWARADTVYADLDRDGQADVVTLAPGRTFTLQVWLSATQTFRQLRSSRQLLKIGAFDLDGNGQLAIVASDVKAGLHIWRRTETGELHRVRPRHTSPSSLAITGRVLTRPVTEAADIPLGGSDWCPTADECDHSTAAAPLRSGRLLSPDSWGLLDGQGMRSASRAPPVSL